MAPPNNDFASSADERKDLFSLSNDSNSADRPGQPVFPLVESMEKAAGELAEGIWFVARREHDARIRALEGQLSTCLKDNEQHRQRVDATERENIELRKDIAGLKADIKNLQAVHMEVASFFAKRNDGNDH
ncbi:hypothetical protein ACHAPJ_003814 [Fusarium lateritium]